MTSRFVLLMSLLVAIGALLIVVRQIIRLPQKYERKPRALNPWSALDNGIDPSDKESEPK